MSAPDGDPPQYVAAHAHDALAADARLAALDLDVRVVHRKVFVSGRVNTDGQRRIAGEVVAAQLPHYDVHNEITVVECSEANEAATERLS